MRGAEAQPNNFYYDLNTSRILVGQAAYDHQIESGSHPADLIELGEFLAGELPVEDPVARQSPNAWTKSDCLVAGRWLLSILPEPDRPKVKKLNERILRKAGQIGIMPGYRQISAPRRFGSFANFYKQLGEIETHRTFTDLSDEAVSAYVGSLFDEFGRLPTVKEVKAKAKADPTLVNYETIYHRFGGLRPAAEAAGKRLPQSWSNKKLVNWGVAFKIANGRTPTEKDIDYFSRRRLCVSSSTVGRRFDGRFSDFKEAVEAAFAQLELKPEYRAHFFKINNGDRPAREWVKKLKKPPEKTKRRKRRPARLPLQRNWSAEEFMQLGLDFMRANQGWVPLAEDLSRLCKQRLSPGANAVIAKYGNFANFQRSLVERYQDLVTNERHHQDKLLNELAAGLASGELPAVLAEDEDEKLVRYAKYLLVDNLLPNSSEDQKIKKSSLDSSQIKRSIRKTDPSISNGDIESHALALSVFDIIWPPEVDKYKVAISPNRIKFRNGFTRKVD